MAIESIEQSALCLRGDHDKYEDRLLCRGPNSKRPSNRGFLYAVADGLSGEKQGSIASDMAIGLLDTHYFRFNIHGVSLPGHLQRGIEYVNLEVFLQSMDPRFAGMGSTLSTLLLFGDRGYVYHVGDSKIYRINDGKSVKLTEDHHDAEGLLTEFIGKGDGLNIFQTSFPIVDGDQFLLCTDGLKVSEAEIERVLKVNSALEKANKELARLARANGSTDDIASILLEIELL